MGRTGTRRATSARGNTSMSTIVGMALALVLIGSVSRFYIDAKDRVDQADQTSAAQSATVQAVNRITRDVADADAIRFASPDLLIVDQTSAPGLVGNQVMRVSYRFTTGPSPQLLTRREPVLAGSSAPEGWASQQPENVLVPLLDRAAGASKFAFTDRKGDHTADAEVVSLVSVDIKALTNSGGRVTLSSAAAVNTGASAASSPGTVTPVAQDKALTVRAGSSSIVNVLRGAACGASPTSCAPSLVSGVVFDTSSAPTLDATYDPDSGDVTVVAAPDAVPATVVLPYTIHTGGQTAAATITVSIIRDPVAPVASNDTETIPVETTRTFNVMANDRCDNGAGELVVGCGAPAQPAVILTTAMPAGFDTLAVDADGAVRVRINRNYTGPLTSKISYRLGDNANPDLPASKANLTLVVGPSARPDNPSGFAGEPMTFTAASLLGNDRFAGAPSAARVVLFGLPDGATYNTFSKSVNWTPSTPGTYPFGYTVTDGNDLSDTGAGTITVNNAHAPVAATAYPYTYQQNQVDLSGGTGKYKLFRSTSTSAGKPSGSVTKVCDSTDGPTSNDCSSPYLDTTPTLGSTWTYSAYDERTPDLNITGWGAAQSDPDRFASDSAKQYPPDPSIDARGSDINADKVVDALGYAHIRLPAVSGSQKVGLKRFVSFQYFGPVLREAMDMGVVTNNASSASCPSGWVNCVRMAGYAAGTEQVWQGYLLDPCDATPATIGATQVINGTTYCTSPSFAYKPAYENTTVNASTDGNAAVVGMEAVRTYQAPSAPLYADVKDGNRSNDIWGWQGGDSCADRADGLNSGTYTCDTGRAWINFNIKSDAGGTDGAIYCMWGTDPGNCHGELTRAGTKLTDPKSGSTTLERDVNGYGYPIAITTSTTQTGYGVSDEVRAANCNWGGCSYATVQPLNSYPAAPAVGLDGTGTSATTQWRTYYSPDAQPNADDCWSTAYPGGSCLRGDQGVVTYVWEPAPGATSYNLDIETFGQESDPWYSHQAKQPFGNNRRATHYAYPQSLLFYNVDSVSAAGLIRTGTYNVFTAPVRTSLHQDSPFCRTAGADGWKFGYAYRQLTRYRELDGTTTWTAPALWRQFWWVGDDAHVDAMNQVYGGSYPYFDAGSRYRMGLTTSGTGPEEFPSTLPDNDVFNTTDVNAAGGLSSHLVGTHYLTGKKLLPVWHHFIAVSVVQAYQPSTWPEATNATIWGGWGPQSRGGTWHPRADGNSLPCSFDFSYTNNKWNTDPNNGNTYWLTSNAGKQLSRTVHWDEAFHRSPNLNVDTCAWGCPW